MGVLNRRSSQSETTRPVSAYRDYARHPSHQFHAGVSPLAKALLDGFSEGVVVFDADGRLLYTNQPAREAMAGMDLFEGAPDLQPRLAALGGRLRPLRVEGLELGEAMFIPGMAGATTLAAREKEAIVKTLDAHSWKLAETARSLGISRTTLWRRLKAYGLHRDGRRNGRKPPKHFCHNRAIPARPPPRFVPVPSPAAPS